MSDNSYIDDDVRHHCYTQQNMAVQYVGIVISIHQDPAVFWNLKYYDSHLILQKIIMQI